MNIYKGGQYINKNNNEVVRVLNIDNERNELTYKTVYTGKVRTTTIPFAYCIFRELTDEEHCDLNQPSGIVPAATCVFSLIVLIGFVALFMIKNC